MNCILRQKPLNGQIPQNGELLWPIMKKVSISISHPSFHTTNSIELHRRKLEVTTCGKKTKHRNGQSHSRDRNLRCSRSVAVTAISSCCVGDGVRGSGMSHTAHCRRLSQHGKNALEQRKTRRQAAVVYCHQTTVFEFLNGRVCGVAKGIGYS